MRVVSLVGNRPQFVKAAAVSRRLRERHEELLVHSGQHYDDELSAVFFRELSLPAPDRQLGVGSGPNAEQVVRIMHEFEPVLDEARPDVTLVYGGTNTTPAAAVTARGGGRRARAGPGGRWVALPGRLPAPAVFPVHPRTRAALERLGALPELERVERLRLTAPLGYLDFTKLLIHAKAVLTD